MLEKKWRAVSPQAFTSNGTDEGALQIEDACVFRVKQEVILKSDTETDGVQFIVNRIEPETDTIYVGRRGHGINDRADISAYLLADNATIEAEEQRRVPLDPEAAQRAVFEEEPVVANRVILVDKCGELQDPSTSNSSIPPHDYKSMAETSTTDVITYRNGGAAGEIVAVRTITWTDSSKCVFLSDEVVIP